MSHREISIRVDQLEAKPCSYFPAFLNSPEKLGGGKQRPEDRALEGSFSCLWWRSCVGEELQWIGGRCLGEDMPLPLSSLAFWSLRILRSCVVSLEAVSGFAPSLSGRWEGRGRCAIWNTRQNSSLDIQWQLIYSQEEGERKRLPLLLKKHSFSAKIPWLFLLTPGWDQPQNSSYINLA